MGGGSDPYCIFFTNPGQLLGKDSHAPITTVKKAFRQKVPSSSSTSDRQHVLRTADSMVGEELSAPAAASAAAAGSASAADVELSGLPTCWADAEVPQLRPHLSNGEQLESVTLLIAVVDHDNISADDILGVAQVGAGPGA